MRKDMHRVIIETSRKGKTYARPIRKKISVHDLTDDGDIKDNYPTKISTKRDAAGSGDPSYQDDRLRPIIRYLKKQVGRRWDDVWSEICANNQDFMGDHLRRHVLGYVSEKVRIEGDEIIDLERNYAVYYYGDYFYVDPVSGVLKQVPRRVFRPNKAVFNIVSMDGVDYFKHDGIWYRVKYRPVSECPSYKVWGCVDDVFGHVRDFFSAYGRSVYCYWKQQANSKECKRLNSLN